MKPSWPECILVSSKLVGMHHNERTSTVRPRFAAAAVRIAVGLTAAAVFSSACSTTSSAPQPSSTPSSLATRQGEMDGLSARGLVDALERAGFPVRNPMDTTAQECPTAGCLQSIVTDTVRVKSFAETRRAQLFAADHGLFQVTTVVVSFAPPVTPDERNRFQAEIQKLML